MFGRKRGERATGDALSGIHARVTELAQRESRIAELVARFETEADAARSATRAAARARDERDEYRRVLAAAIAREQRAEARLEAVDAERLDAHGRAGEAREAAARASAERDALEGRLAALETLVRDQAEQFERSLADVQDRAWTEREAARAELLRLTDEARRGADQVAQAVGREVRDALDSGDGPGGPGAAATAALEAASITGMRRRLLVGLGLGSAAAGAALAPSAVLAASDAERGMFVELASGLGPGQLAGLAVLSFALAAGLLTLARRDALRARVAGA